MHKDIKDFKTKRRGRQRELSTGNLQAKQQLCTCITLTLFVHFFARFCMTTT